MTKFGYLEVKLSGTRFLRYNEMYAGPSRQFTGHTQSEKILMINGFKLKLIILVQNCTLKKCRISLNKK